jgi:hypothetical protein
VELATTLRDLIFNCHALSHYAGIRRGYLVSRRLKKPKARKKKAINKERVKNAKAEIARLIKAHPDWTIKQIFVKLDNEEMLIYWLGRVRRHVRLWADFVGEPAYKMLVSRLSKKVRRKTRDQGFAID